MSQVHVGPFRPEDYAEAGGQGPHGRYYANAGPGFSGRLDGVLLG